MTDNALETSTTARRSLPFWQLLGVGIVFGLFYAYDLWEAVSNLIGVSMQAQGLGTTLSGTGWAILIAGVVLPPLVFALCIWLGRRRGLFALVLILLTGLCALAALSLSMLSMFTLGSLIV